MKTKSEVLFVSAIPDKLDREQTLPARFMRLLDKTAIQETVKGKTVAVKMHVGGALGYSTIHPLFVKLLIDHIKAGKPRDIFVTDGSVKNASDRGYTKQTIGARLVSSIGEDGKDVTPKKTGWKHLERVYVSKPVLKADVLVNFCHVKGHGDASYGAACKNLAMGLVPRKTRFALHSLEGKLKWQKSKCIHCNKCLDECTTHANSFNKDGEYEIFWHHCRMCLHCMLVCPTKAIKLVDRKTERFQEGLARVAKLVLDNFKPGNVFHINVLTDITIFCDCWGMTTPSLVPDIGIMASEDIVAIEDATLKAIKVKDLIPGSITPPYKLGKGKHLFEKLHAKDPFVQVQALKRLKAGSGNYRVVKVK